VDIEGIEPNYYLSALFVPNDPYYKYQWHLDLIGMQKVWEYPGGATLVVAVIDTGIAYEKFQDRFPVEDLEESQFVKPRNFVDGNDHANDDHGHGTHVAGTIAQLTNNGVGVAGVAPFVRLMPLKVLNAQGYGTVSDIAAAIRYAADNGASVINLSLGGPFPSFILHKAIRYAHGKGVTVVCAAGNSGGSGLSYPARYPECISVSAVRYDRTLTWYSSYGKGLTIAAPGGDMNVDQNEDGLVDGVLQNTLNPQDPSQQGYFLFQGTSMAAPHVAAAAALLVSHGVTDPDKVKEVLRNAATPVENGARDRYGAGVLNAEQALRSVFYRRNFKLLVFALALVIALLAALNRRRLRTEKVPFGFAGLLGLMLGSTGFFFLGKIPYASGIFFLTHSAAQWQLAISGADDFASPLVFSALPVLLIALLCYPWKKLTAFSVAFAAGYSAYLLFQSFSPTAGITFVPGAILECVWLFINGLIALGIAAMAAFRIR
jgi:serine protease